MDIYFIWLKGFSNYQANKSQTLEDVSIVAILAKKPEY